ncbi:UDP-N-acetylmuramoyl-L-alanine--D-glutamate ligase [Streptococcaceae bacterium ESL0729]|nr:UDP-N-acetylmuramoyl-L-alanine--D-glutamate ligase [Streptococcaceae bacterium ESL0729]
MKKISKFQNEKVLVLGLAKSGASAAKVLNSLGAFVTVNDGKKIDENVEGQELLEKGIRVISGSHPLELLDEDFSLLVKNPGIPYENPMVARALSKGIPVITEVELAYLISQADIIGITGSNGKTTTTTMIADILNGSGMSAKLAGNIGFPASDVATKATSTDTLVMELSSFQLMGIDEFHPHIALITNIFSAHLDYHGSQENYEAAKWRIQENMDQDDYLVLNYNQKRLRDLAQETKAQVVFFSSTDKVNGAYAQDGKIYYQDEYVMDVADLSLPGDHNLENALAAISVSKLKGATNASIIEVLSHFSGVKHRLQFVASIDDIKFYNDSKATNILATQKALSGFENDKLWLLAGGLDRGNGFEELSSDIENLKGMIVFGQTAPKLKELAESQGIFLLESKDVAEAARLAYDHAQAGDTVLLSPANASWDQYPNFEIRGDIFIKEIEKIKESL